MKTVLYNNLLTVLVKEKKEPFTYIPGSALPNGYLPGMRDMANLSGPRILVRKTVLGKLIEAQFLLQSKRPELSLYIMYGYRTKEIQTSRFLKRLRSVSDSFFANPIDLYEMVHRTVAVPTVAGHPTGGAIDIMLVSTHNGHQVDFGSIPYDYKSQVIPTFSQGLTKNQKANRLLLRQVLMAQDFAPFDGEWWHFSYGDREWAYYYNKPYAHYDQISYNQLQQEGLCKS